jgi:hypothetical protein
MAKNLNRDFHLAASAFIRVEVLRFCSLLFGALCLLAPKGCPSCKARLVVKVFQGLEELPRIFPRLGSRTP